MTDSAENEIVSLNSAPAEVELRFGEKVQWVAYEQAFALACSLLEQGHAKQAAMLFERLEQFTDHGPRAFIMQAFCEAAALHFDSCSKPLVAIFDGRKKSLAAELHNAFVSYHVGIRQEALNAMVDLVNEHRDLPTLCLLLGNMLQASGKLAMARKCWSLAVHRDHPSGAVALVAAQQLQRSANQ